MPPPSHLIVHGVVVAPARGAWRSALQALSGIALLRGVAALCRRILRFRVAMELELNADLLHARSRTRLLHATLTEREQFWPVRSLVSAARRDRLSLLPLWLGLLCLAIGILLGGLWIFDGLLTGDAWVLLGGAVVLGFGVGADIVLNLAPRAPRYRYALDLIFADRVRLHVGGLQEAESRQFMQALQASWLRHTSPHPVTSQHPILEEATGGQ